MSGWFSALLDLQARKVHKVLQAPKAPTAARPDRKDQSALKDHRDRSDPKVRAAQQEMTALRPTRSLSRTVLSAQRQSGFSRLWVRRDLKGHKDLPEKAEVAEATSRALQLL